MNKPSFGSKVNPGLSISKGIVGAWLLNEGGGTTAYDSSGVVSPKNMTLSGSPLPTWSVGTYGSTIVFPPTGSNTIGSATLPTGLVLPLSYMVGIRPVVFNTSTYYASFGSGSKEYLYTNGASGFAYANGGSTIITGQVLVAPLQCVVVVTQASDGTGILYTNGSVGVSGATGTNAPASVNIGNVPGFSLSCNANIDFIIVWNRVLSSTEASILAANPFAPYQENFICFKMI